MAENNLLNRYPRFKGAIKTLVWIGINFFMSIIVFLLYIIKPFKFVKLFQMTDWRIGHLAANTELLFRRIQLGKVESKGITFVGLASTKTANQQLLKMLKRKLTIIQIPQPGFILTPKMNIFGEKSILGRSIFYQPTPFNSNMYYEFNNTKPNLSFTDSEEEKGKKLLKKMGIDDNSWFVCFHSRSSAYSASQFNLDTASYNHRDCDIKNYLEAAKYIASLGGFAVRMGSVVEEKLPDLNNPRIIDYASYHRTDFGDIYLPAKCKFFLGSASGLCVVPTIFNVPLAGTNFIPFHTPFKKGDLFIPKKIWSIKEKRFLTFKEMLGQRMETHVLSEVYTKRGLKPVQNTTDEILDLAEEMNGRLDGTFEYTEEDEELQKKFYSLIQPHHHCYGTPARIGAKFLRQNRELLE